jgi:hypothetical protein
MGNTFKLGKLVNGFTVLDNGNVGVGTSNITSNQGSAIAIGTSSGGNISIVSNRVAGTSGSPLYLDLSFRGYNDYEMARIRSWDESTSTGNGNLTFWTLPGGSSSPLERMRITNNGHIGVGATPSSWGTPFIAIQGGSYGQHIAFQTNNADMKIGVNNYFNGTGYIYHTTNKAASQLNVSADGGLTFSTAGTGTAGNAITFAEKFAITNAGLVRINTTSTLGGGLLGLNGNIEFGGTAGGNYRVTNYQAGYLAFDTDNTERLRLTSTGLVLINKTTAAGYNLEVNGSALFDKSDGTYVAYAHSGNLVGYVGVANQVVASGSIGNMGINATNHLVFSTGSGAPERARINIAGKFCVGTSDGIGQITNYVTGSTITSGSVTFDSQAKGYELYNSISGTTDNLVGYWFSVGPHKSGIASGRTNAGAGWELDLRFFVHDSSTTNLNNCYEKMRLYGGGNLTINGSLTQNGSLSDLTLKENIVKISNPLDKISKINGYTFTWKDNAPARMHLSNILEDAGLIAQEVEQIIPEIVRPNDDGTKALNYNGVVGLLVEVVKELKAEIDILKNK